MERLRYIVKVIALNRRTAGFLYIDGKDKRFMFFQVQKSK